MNPDNPTTTGDIIAEIDYQLSDHTKAGYGKDDVLAINYRIVEALSNHSKQLRDQLAAEQESGKSLMRMHRDAVIKCNKARKQLTTVMRILEATKPLAKAWAAEDLEDQIEDWLKEVADG